MNKRAENTENALTTQVSEFLAPATIRSLFWRPRFAVESKVLVHAPFLFWLTSVIQPRRVAVLGADDGVAHFMFCQSLDKMGTLGRVDGIGLWADEKDKAGCVPANLADHEESFYEDISMLCAASDIVAAAETLPDDSFDLLFVDLTRFNDDVQPGIEAWQRMLRDGAVLLLHGTNETEIRPRLAGALQKLAERHSMIRFRDGAGLTVVAVGSDMPPRLQNLMSAASGSEMPPEIAVIFRRLGQSIVKDIEVKGMRSRENAASKELAEVQRSLEKVSDELSALQQNYELRSRKLAEAESMLFNLRSDLEGREKHEEMLEAECNKAIEGKAEAEARVAATKSEVEASSRIRFEETAALTQQLEELRVEMAEKISDAEARAAAAQNEIELNSRFRFEETAVLTRMLEELRAQAEAEASAAATKSEVEASSRIRLEETAALTQQLEELRVEMAEKIAEAEARAAAAQNETELNSQLRFEETAALTRMLEELRARAEAAEASVAATKSEVEASSRIRLEETAALKRQLKKLRAEMTEKIAESEARAAAAQNEAELNSQLRFEETAALTRMLEELRAQAEAAEARVAVEVSEKLTELEIDKMRLQEYNDALLSSTSWRITAPIRKFRQAFKR